LEGIARFESADAGLVEPRIRDFGPDLAVVNPPRRGLGPDTVAALKRSGPRALLYSSCAIDSLAQDLGALEPEYPGVRRARLFDLFPHTAHFETLVWLQRSGG
jgi:23S rRNA (uracil747-C5)-methyltransferase